MSEPCYKILDSISLILVFLASLSSFPDCLYNFQGFDAILKFDDVAKKCFCQNLVPLLKYPLAGQVNMF